MKMEQQTLEITAISQDKLESMHEGFIKHISSLPDAIHGGSFTIVNTNLSACALGFPFDIAHRFIRNNKKYFALEYAFVYGTNCYFCLYLDELGYCYTDPELSNKFCEFTDHDIQLKVVAALANALLESPLLAPRTVIGADAG
jgi:hypothetical protein